MQTFISIDRDCKTSFRDIESYSVDNPNEQKHGVFYMWSFPWNRCILETAQAGIRVIGLFVFTLLVSVIGERLSISNTQIIIYWLLFTNHSDIRTNP